MLSHLLHYKTQDLERMKKINDIDTALEVFTEAAKKQSKATEEGVYKTGNISYDEISNAVSYIKSENKLDTLRQFLSHPSIGVRMWAACYLLPIAEKEGEQVLKEIANGSGIIAHTAETTLIEWKKGNLKF